MTDATHASGSTSQGANIMEAISCGSKLLLIDEDQSATNFMIRDSIMTKLVKKEPITPYTDRVNQLADMGISTILVIGGSSEYLAVADNIFMMNDFILHDATSKAKSVVTENKESKIHHKWQNERYLSEMFTSYPSNTTRELLQVLDTGFIMIGDERIDIRYLHNIVSNEHINALAFILRYLSKEEKKLDDFEVMSFAIRGLTPKTIQSIGRIDILENIKNLYSKIYTEGLNHVDSGYFTSMSRFMELPRQFEVIAAINRMRHITW